jgi:hypothetical protein
MRASLRRFAALVAATARTHGPAATPEEDVQLVALSLVGLLERVVSDREDGELAVAPERLVDRCVAIYSKLLRTFA